MNTYQPRLLDPHLEAMLSELSGVLIVGPRASGKTTTAKQHAASVIDLADEAMAAAVQADPTVALRGLAEPILVDEWQLVPTVLTAIKRTIDEDPRPGRFLVTGSVRTDLESPGWPATGRLTRVAMYGMTVREQLGNLNTSTLLDRLADQEELVVPAAIPDLAGYIDFALRGGFPTPALRLSPRRRQEWIEGYVDQVVTRDALQLGGHRDPEKLRRYLEAYALNSAGTIDEHKLLSATELSRPTAVAYEHLLTNLSVIENLPAWTINRLKRMTHAAKRYLVDSSLLGGILQVDLESTLRDGDLMGRLLETFVVSQLRAELAISPRRPRLYHLRQQNGRHEIDIVAELMGRGIVALEIKSKAAVGLGDARHLMWLRDELGERFLAGVVLHTGPRIFQLNDRISAVPICA
ncbi:MAG: ATP-binding protein, partial [Candidatus Dormibacteraceae bacterium]